jgi:hypothetical protein
MNFMHSPSCGWKIRRLGAHHDDDVKRALHSFNRKNENGRATLLRSPGRLPRSRGGQTIVDVDANQPFTGMPVR